MKDYHQVRLPPDRRRAVLWKVLCEHYFQLLINPDATVLELGAGYGDFINNIRCAGRIAVDRWAGFADYLQPGIRAIVGTVSDLSPVDDHSVDFAFASNLFEHLTQADFVTVVNQLRTKLKPGGTLNILQPNYRFAYKDYFDDYTHVSVYSDRSLRDFLTVHGFRVIDCQPRFLPLTVRSGLPVVPALIRLYLASPFKPLGKQMLLRAVVEP